jgi:hypothetical protein
MLKRKFTMPRVRALCTAVLAAACFLPVLANAQGLPDAPVPQMSVRSAPVVPHTSNFEHRFWDKENSWLFAGVAASRTLDYFSTLNMRRRGRQEIFLSNDLVDNHAAFAAVEAAAVGTSIAASYLFHRYHHHKLERWTSIVHFSLATAGAVRNYCLVTAHTSAAPASAPWAPFRSPSALLSVPPRI